MVINHYNDDNDYTNNDDNYYYNKQIKVTLAKAYVYEVVENRSNLYITSNNIYNVRTGSQNVWITITMFFWWTI